MIISLVLAFLNNLKLALQSVLLNGKINWNSLHFACLFRIGEMIWPEF